MPSSAISDSHQAELTSVKDELEHAAELLLALSVSSWTGAARGGRTAGGDLREARGEQTSTSRGRKHALTE